MALNENREKLLRLADNISQDKVTDDRAAEEMVLLFQRRNALFENWDALIDAALCNRKAILDGAVIVIRRIERLSE